MLLAKQASKVLLSKGRGTVHRDIGRFERWVPVHEQDYPKAVENSKELFLLLSNQLWVLPHTLQDFAQRQKALNIFNRSLWLHVSYSQHPEVRAWNSGDETSVLKIRIMSSYLVRNERCPMARTWNKTQRET